MSYESAERLRHELLSDVSDRVKNLLLDYGLPKEAAEQCGSAVADDLCTHWAGQNITIPMDYWYKLTQRDLEIWDKFTGNNHLQLAREYNLTVNAIYRIIKRIHRRAVSKHQPDIFGNKSA